MKEQNGHPLPESTLHLPGLEGRQLVRLVTARLLDLPGVELVRADGRTGVVVVQGAISDADLRSALIDLGLPASGEEVAGGA